MPLPMIHGGKGSRRSFPFQSLGDDVRHFVIFARKGTEGFKQDQALHLFGKRGGIEQAHTAAEEMTDDG